MAYIPNTAEDTRAMLDVIGARSVEDLFADVPEVVRLKDPVGPERPLSEYELLRLMSERAGENNPAAGCHASFLGGGSYEHVIPSAVHALAQRGEVLTAYTPYQAEASQGTLQIIYEFQSMICELTGLEASNASMYDGASALAEAVLMAVRISGKHQVVLPATLNPAWREVVESYTGNLGLEFLTWGADASGALTDASAWPAEANEVAAAVIAQPNIWGYLEPAPALASIAKEAGALVIAAVNPMSLSVVSPPGAWGADIAVGEAQPIGLPMNFGGPYAGFMACRTKHVRKMPGRIVGRTKDKQGRDAFVLTLQTREQHIRRERATSNICTNQGLCAAMVTMWLSMVGRSGFEKLGGANLERAASLLDGLKRIKGIEPIADAPFFNEFSIRLPIPAAEFCDRLRAAGVLAGLPAPGLGLPGADRLIVCATETKLDSDIERYLAAAGEALER